MHCCIALLLAVHVFELEINLCEKSQLQAGETLRNTSHSSTAADLLQTRQQLSQYQQQIEEMNIEVKKHQERNSEQLEHISQLQHKLSEAEMVRTHRYLSDKLC